MNGSLNVIPTPKYCRYSPGQTLAVSKICIVGQQTPVLRHALNTLQGITNCAQQDAQVIIYVDFALVPSALLDTDDLGIFRENLAEEQGYILKTVPSGQIVIIAKNPIGCAYGVLTLRQMIGLPVGDFTIRDWPDFRRRGMKWLLWAELGAWSFDFGDGVDAIVRRMKRSIDQLFLYKVNNVYADGYGFSVDRFEGYTDIMRTISDYARERGIRIGVGGYSMGYGMVGHLNSYQGKDYYNRKSYPDGEIYECLGTYAKGKEPVQWRTLNRGTCLSNEALFDLKMEEITAYLRKTHVTSLSLHNMDAHDIAAGWWETRCDACKKRWPNSDLFAKDGAAGAIAEYIDKIMRRLREVKDGDYDAARDLSVRMSSPGYMYTFTTDEDFDTGIRFWAAVSEYMQERDKFSVGFREQHFYHSKPVYRANTIKKSDFKIQSSVGFFNGCDGFYDDKLFTTTAALSYSMKGYTSLSLYNGNIFQEPLQVFNAEYLWNSENSGFYNVSPRPANYEEYNALFENMLNSTCRPEEVYGDGGFLDVICQKLYGQEVGLKLARLYKLCGKNGEPPIAYASNVDLFTNYSKVVYPMAWETPMKQEDISAKTERFCQCGMVSHQAVDILDDVLKHCDLEQNQRDKFTVFRECFGMGAALCDLLYRYMLVYGELHDAFERGNAFSEERVMELKPDIAAFTVLVNDPGVQPVDKFEGIFIRRKEMADFLAYNTDMMVQSIRQGKRIPDGTRAARTRDWW